MPHPARLDDRAQLLLFEPPRSAALDDAADGSVSRPPAGAGTGLRETAGPALPPSVIAHPRGQRHVQLHGHLVGYELRRARRRSIGFAVDLEGLSVAAPRWVTIGDIESALRHRADWILRKLVEQRDRARRLEAARVDWRDGTQLPYLGGLLCLRLAPEARGAVLDAAAPHGGPLARERAPAARADTPSPAAPAGTLRLGLPPGAEPAQIRDLVQGWLQRQARRVFEERCALLAPPLGVQVRRLSLSSAQTRWGSASADGSIRLNWRLIHLSLPTIDYVVAHELAHLRHMDHSAAFWAVVRSVVPDLDLHRDRLRDEVLPVFD